MSKTELTKEIERALFARTAKTIGSYGALEVTIGHISGVEGYDRCDYVEFDTKGQFTCYEIKVSLEDFLSKNKLSYVGNKNYLVAPSELANIIKKEHVTGSHGIIAYDNGNFKVIKRSSQHTIGIGEKVELLEAFAKSASRDATKYYLTGEEKT